MVGLSLGLALESPPMSCLCSNMVCQTLGAAWKVRRSGRVGTAGPSA